MTSKERLLTVINGGIPDRVPVSPFVQQEFLSYYYQKNDTCRVVDALALSQELHFDLMTRHQHHIKPHYLRKSYPNWELEQKDYIEKGIYNRESTITTPEGTLHQREVAPYNPATIAGIHFTTAEYMLKEPEDFEIFRKYMPARDRAYVEEMQEVAKWAVSTVGDAGLCCPWATGGVYNHASEIRSVEDLMCDPIVDEDFYQQLMQFLSDMIRVDFDLLCNTPYDIIGVQGNIANAAMLGLDFFAEHVQPYETKLIDTVKSYGKHTLYHNCGVASALYPAYKEMQMSIFETLSTPPVGDNDLATAKAFFGDTLTLAGNLDQVTFLKTATVDEVRAMTESIMAVGKPGGHFIFAASDFLEKDTPLENVRAMIDTANRCSAL